MGPDDASAQEGEEVSEVIAGMWFEAETTPGTKEEWSFSKRQMLFQCTRRYYYHYFGSSRRTAKGEPLKAQLRELKDLTNVHLRTGDILDLMIRTYLKKAAEGDRWNTNRLVNWAVDIFRRDKEFNSTKTSRARCEKFAPSRLVEYYYDFGDAEARYVEAEHKLVTAIRNFLQSGSYSEYLEYGSQPGAMIQEFAHLRIDGSPARGRLDLAFRLPERFQIVDWKIGSGGSADENLQIGFYGLWAHSKADVHEPIWLAVAYVGSGTAMHFDLGAINPRRVRARITQDLNVMRALSPFGTSGNSDAFSPYGQPKICALCQFQGVCPKRE